MLEEAENPRVPLLERLRFLSISADNLDEFYTVRVAGLRELAQAGNTTPAADGLTPAEQLVLINEEARALMSSQQQCLANLLREMDEQNIMLEGSMTSAEMTLSRLTRHFLSQVFAVLSPLAIDPAHPFPFLPNTGFALALQLERTLTRNPCKRCCRSRRRLTALCPCPRRGHQRFLPLEDLLVLKIPDLFPGLQTQGAFRVPRAARQRS